MNAGKGGLGVEQETIYQIPAAERHGRPRDLFTIWFGSNIMIINVFLGSIGTTEFHMPFWPAVLAIVLGNLIGGIFMALHAAQGPRLGVPQMVQSRGQFGSVGAILIVGVVVVNYVGWFVSVNVLGAESLQTIFPGLGGNTGVLLVAVVSVAVAIYGYDLIHTYGRVLTYLSGAALVLSFIWVIFVTGVPANLGTLGTYSMVGFLGTLSVSTIGQLGYAPNVSDYSRYLPADTGPKAAFWSTYWGNTLGCLIPQLLGALIGMTAANGDVVAGLAASTGKAGFVIIALFGLSITCSNAINVYGGVLGMVTFGQTFAPGWKPGAVGRTALSVFILIIGGAMSLYAQSDFITNFTNFIFLLLYALIPWTAINLVDYYLIRHGDYDVKSFFRDDGGIYGRFNAAAIICYIGGILIEIPFMSTPLFTGPIAKSLDGSDISWLVGLVVVSPVYYVMARNNRQRDAAKLSRALG